MLEVSCCDSVWVPGGWFEMGFSRSEAGDALGENDVEHRTFVNGFFLDRFEVTRSRFYQFALQYEAPPAIGSGRHPLIEGTGWEEGPPVDWDRQLPSDGEELLQRATCAGDDAGPIWPSLAASASFDLSVEIPDAAPAQFPGADLPVACLDWFTAFAFCAWDGGRLPTEAEWEAAATGGSLNRPYPWGDASDVVPRLQMDAEVLPVGSRPWTATAEGHQDLAGSVLEWVFDWFNEDFYSSLDRLCQNCADLEPSNGRGVRGAKDSSCCISFDTEFRSAARHLDAPGNRARPGFVYGVRCARDRPASP
jgi:sulfatase modifying factor 1